MTMRWGVLLAVAVAVAVASCDSSDDAAPSRLREPARPFQVKDDVAAKKVTRGAEAQAASTVSLLPDGLIVGGAGKGAKMTVVRFGDGEAQVLRTLTDRLGQPKESTGRECAAGPMRLADFAGLRVSFINGQFVGWLAERGRGLNTGEGIGPDWPYARLERIGAKRVAGSTLEGEFTLTDAQQGKALGGFLDKSGKVLSLYGGTNCFAR